MPLFPSEAWCAAAVAAVHSDPESAEAGRGFAGSVALVVEGARPFTAWCRLGSGRIQEWRVLADPGQLEALLPRYIARASLDVWRGLLEGTRDPVEAVLERQLRLVGDLQPLVERLRYRDLGKRVLASIETRFDPEDAR